MLAQKVLCGATRGYRHHPQLARFRASPDPQAAVASYLAGVHEEAVRRGYAFDADKIAGARLPGRLDETRGQLLYEWDHLRRKLATRDPRRYDDHRSIKVPAPHPLFHIVPGAVQTWERVVEQG